MSVVKWLGLVVASGLVLIVIAAFVLFLLGRSKLDRGYTVAAETITVPSDSASIAWGEHLVTIHTCQDCHGDDLGGKAFMDMPLLRAVGSNLTSGRGGVGGRMSDADWERAIRHSVSPDGKMLLIMPTVYHALDDHETGAIIAYLKQLPPIDNEITRDVRVPGYIMLGMPGFDPGIEVALEGHTGPPSHELGPTAEYGAYRASTICAGCHGPDMTGGPPVGPGSPAAPSLVVAGTWPYETFERAMREGIGQGDRPLDPEWMPWPRMKAMSDDELHAVFAYLQELAAKAGATPGEEE